MDKLHLITSNIGKLEAAKITFDEYGITLTQIKNTFPEIQADTSIEVAKYTAKQISIKHNIHVIREDHSIVFNALGIPGIFSSYFNQKVDNHTLLKILSSFQDRSGYFEVSAVYSNPKGNTIESSYKINFTVSQEEKGGLQKGINKLIIIDGTEQTLAEYPESERTNLWNKNFHTIAKKITSDDSFCFRK